MAFEVIPAIDIAGGRLARHAPDGPVDGRAFGGDPVAAARAFVDAGAAHVHVVDMDLAFSGDARNGDVLRSIVALGAHVQAAGAIVDDGEIAARSTRAPSAWCSDPGRWTTSPRPAG